jgi:hypothetical protein
VATGTPACAPFRDARVAQPFPTLSNTPNPCLPERSAAAMAIARLNDGRGVEGSRGFLSHQDRFREFAPYSPG